jgi:UDP-3-O-[3-hydroxymyristoyl] N-acetylglucosamine deacetylase
LDDDRRRNGGQMRCAFTLASAVEVCGVGLHSGRRVSVRLTPGRAGDGIRFVRKDLGGASLAASPAAVCQTTLSTALGSSNGVGHSSGEPHAQTVEHLMAALCGVGISACVVELDATELPLLDGSASSWLSLIDQAKLAPLPSPPEQLSPRTPVWASHADAWVIALPSPSPQLTYGIDFGRFAPIGAQWFSWAGHTGAGGGAHASPDVDVASQLISAGLVAAADPHAVAQSAARAASHPCRDSFRAAVAPARTFATTDGVAAARAAGLAVGGSLECALVCDEVRWLGDRPLRFPNEPVRHKTLDLIGDLALLGRMPAAHVVAYKASHRLHVALARALAGGEDGAAREEHYV